MRTGIFCPRNGSRIISSAGTKMALDYSKWDNLDDSDDEDSRQQYNRDQPSTAQPSPPALSGRLAELSNDPGVT